MTFQEWQATRKWHDDLSPVIDCDLDGASGFEYEGSYIIRNEEGFVVQIGTTEAAFDTIEGAEAYLWSEWADSEING